MHTYVVAASFSHSLCSARPHFVCSILWLLMETEEEMAFNEPKCIAQWSRLIEAGQSSWAKTGAINERMSDLLRCATSKPSLCKCIFQFATVSWHQGSPFSYDDGDVVFMIFLQGKIYAAKTMHRTERSIAERLKCYLKTQLTPNGRSLCSINSEIVQCARQWPTIWLHSLADYRIGQYVHPFSFSFTKMDSMKVVNTHESSRSHLPSTLNIYTAHNDIDNDCILLCCNFSQIEANRLACVQTMNATSHQ